MRQYLVVGLGLLVLVVGLVAKSYLNKQAPAATSDAPITTVVRAGQALSEALTKATPAQHSGLEPQFAALASACAGLGPASTPTAKQLCERAEVLRQAAKAGTSTPEGARDVQQAMDALASATAPAR